MPETPAELACAVSPNGRRARLSRLINWGTLLLLVAVGLGSFDRANRGTYDFHHFYRDARYVWEHHALNPDVPAFTEAEEARQLPFYLPVVPLVLAPLTACGRWPAALVWAVLQVLSLGYSLRELRRWCGTAERAYVLTVLLGLPAVVEATRFNQLSFIILALLLAGLSALERQRDKTAGAFFALAAVIKLLPALFLPWLLLKRRWRAAATCACVALGLVVLPPTLAFGPRRALQYHVEWWAHNVRGDSADGLLNMAAPNHLIDHRNQSIAQVLARWTWPEHRYPAPWQPVRLAAPTVRVAGVLISTGLLAVLLWFTRRACTVSRDVLRGEFAVYAMALLILSPLLRQYYLVWAFPALALLACWSFTTDIRRLRQFGVTGLAIWTAGMLAWMSPTARLLGVHLLMLLALSVIVLWACRSITLALPAIGTRPHEC